ncbi:MAG: hypothetical protein ACE5EU_00140 [Paracoccaceae bacterium]
MSPGLAIRSGARALYTEVASMSVIDLVLRMTLILLILHSGYFWYLRVPMALLCIVGLIYRRLYREPWFWLIVCCVMAWGSLLNWFQIDNHKFLMLYWLIAIYCSLLSGNQERTLALNAKLMIGLVFGFAVIWKAITPDYLSGQFFEFELLADSRFSIISTAIAGMSVQQLTENNYLIGQLTAYDGILTEVKLQSAERIGLISGMITWWTILIEAVIAVLFLLPDSPLLHRLRDASLLLFAVTTYAVANVIGFGWLLMIMGVAQCRREDRVTRFLYVATFLLILIYTAPWAEIIMQDL